MDKQLPQPRAMLDKSKFYNNTEPKTLKKKFETILRNQAIINLDFLVGYFRISGFKHLYDLLQNRISTFQRVRILVGLNVDELVAHLAQQKVDIKTAYSEQFKKIFHKNQLQNIQEDAYHNGEEIDQSLELFINALKEEKIQIRMVKDKNVHAKFYIFSQEPVLDSTNNDQSCIYTGSLIVGSSNLSDNGLVKQYEFNAELNQSEDLEIALYEFNQLWDNSIEITSEDIKQIQEESCLKIFTPQEIYHKLLIEYFGRERIEIDRRIEDIFPKNFKPLEYQIEAISDGIQKLEKYNGFFLSDVVGLGKTLIATLVAKKLIIDNKLQGDILITCPPALEKSWKQHFSKAEIRRHYEVKTHDKLKHLTQDEISRYELIIVDESHRFKSSGAQRYQHIQRICKDSTLPKKLILLSATPQNNSPQDIANQLYLFQNKYESKLQETNLFAFFKRIEKKYNEIKDDLKELASQYEKNENKIEELKARLKDISEDVREKILKQIMIRRTRKDIENSFEEDFKKQGLRFPQINGPQDLTYTLTDKIEALSRSTLDFLDMKETSFGKYEYYRYLTYKNLTDEGKKNYASQVDKQQREEFYEQSGDRLAGLMKSLLFKRFESSFTAFRETLKGQINSIKTCLVLLEEKGIFYTLKSRAKKSSPLAFYQAFRNMDTHRIKELYDKNPDDFVINQTSDFRSDYITNLKNDLVVMEKLLAEWEQVSEDSKVNKLIDVVGEKLKNHTASNEVKIVIFTEYKTTAKYIFEKLKPHYKVLKVDADNRQDHEEDIRENFDANYENQKDDFHILITTDTLAEGVNMHRSNIIINYDAPWNATRLMQRAGRINRVGTKHDEIFIYNFKPSNLGEEILNFSKLIFQKLQTFHYILGEDSAFYSEDEDIEIDGIYIKDLTKLPEELDPELEYLTEIRKLYKNDKKEFQRIVDLPNKIKSLFEDEGESYFYFKQNILQNDEKHSLYCTNDYFYKVQNTNKNLFEKEVDRITFLEIAKHLKSKIEEKKIQCKATLSSHYQDAKEALRYHNKELGLQDQVEETLNNPNTLFSDNLANALSSVKHNTEITQEEREILITALRQGKTTTQEELDIIKRKNLSEIIQKYQHISTHKREYLYPEPNIQLGYTTKRKTK